MKRLFILLSILIATISFASELEEIRPLLANEIEQSILTLQKETDSSVKLSAIFDEELYQEQQIIRIRLYEKPLQDYYWEAIIELKDIDHSNLTRKMDELILISVKEYELHKKNREKGKEVLRELIPALDDQAIGLAVQGNHIIAWVQLPADKKWMRTTILFNSAEDALNARIRSTIWSISHQETYYDQTDVGIFEIGAIEGIITENQSLDMIVNIIKTKSARSYDLNQHLSFFYQYGSALSLDFISINDNYSFDLKASGEIRVGLILSDSVALSLGSEVATNFGSKYFLTPDLKLSFTQDDLSISLNGGYTFSNNFDERTYLLSPRWNAGVSIRVRLK